MRARERHHVTCFTPEQIKILSSNPFTKTVSACRISYTLEFKNLFLAQYHAGERIYKIFENLGYDTSIIGDNRIYSFTQRLLNQVESGEPLTEATVRSKIGKPVDVDYNTMPAQQSVAAMQREIAYLRQQVDFLKKLTELGNGKKSRT